MSTRMKRVLIIGGSLLGAVVICLVAAALFSTLRGGAAFPASAPMDDRAVFEGGYGEAEMAYEEAMEEAGFEAPAAEPSFAGDGADMDSGPGLDIEGQNLQQGEPIERVIIRNGDISMTVENTREARRNIEQMVASMAQDGAFIVSSNESGSGREGNPYISMSIRVPADRFAEVMARLTEMAVEGTNPSISETADDVTEEYVDLQARIENLEAARDRLLVLMEDARTTEDLLMAEQQLTMRETEIEALKGRLRYLSQAARLSRINISLQPYILSQPVDARWRPAETVREAFNALIDALRDFGDFAIFFAIAMLPWLLLLALIVFGVVRFVQWRLRVRARRKAASTPAVLDE